MPRQHQAGPFCGLEDWIDLVHTRKMNHSEMLRYYGLLRLVPPGVHTILDAGCGKGYMCYLLAQAGYTVHGVDINETSLAIFQHRCQTYGITQAREDLYTYRPPVPFDLVLCQEVLEHLPHPDTALIELARFVAPGGYGILCVPYRENLASKMITDPVTGRQVHKNGHLHSFDPEGFRALFELAGFREVRRQLLTSKRLLNWMGEKKRRLSGFWTGFDRTMNRHFPHRATYMAFLVRKA